MWLYVKQLIQLILSPTRGWEDVSESCVLAADIQRRGFYPFIGLTAASEFLRLFYTQGLGFWSVVLSAIALGGTMFVSFYLVRLFMELAAMRIPLYSGHYNAVKTDIFVTYMMGINCFYKIVENMLPANMTLLKFLPLISLIIIFKAESYMAVRPDSQLNFLGIAGVAVIGVPWCVGQLLSLII